MIFLLLLTFLTPQEYQYGKPVELKGMRRIYVDTDSDVKTRNKIIDKLKQAKLDLEFPDNPDNAQIFLTYSAGSERRTIGVPTRNGTMIAQPEYPYGVGAILIVASPKPKLVFSFHDQQNTAFEKSPLTNFIKEVTKLLKENH